MIVVGFFLGQKLNAKPFGHASRVTATEQLAQTEKDRRFPVPQTYKQMGNVGFGLRRKS